MDLKQIAQRAFTLAVKKSDAEILEQKLLLEDRKKINSLRSQSWVESLAKEFREEYTDKYIKVFSKYYKGNRKEFGLNELLYDVSVCRINFLQSPKNNKQLAYIEKAVWLVESEMAKNTRELLYDFNKLIIGDAENKLFIGPRSEAIEGFLEELKKAAQYCHGNLFIALIPHPNEWNNVEMDFKLWKFEKSNWIQL